MTHSQLTSILLCGQGFAFEAALAALSKALPETIKITALELTSSETDIFYGNVTSPIAYDFHYLIGLTEPELIYKTDTSFSFGTQYQNWAGHLDWVQSHQLPFPVWQGVSFHHYLLRLNRALEPYLVGATCGKNGNFAHPPSDPNIALSRAEYGYQFSPANIAALLKSKPKPDNVVRKKGTLKHVHSHDENITSVELETGERLDGQLYIDATGSEGMLMRALGNAFRAERTLRVIESLNKDTDHSSSLRKVRGEDFGWTSTTTLRGVHSRLTVSHPDMNEAALNAHKEASISQDIEVQTGDRALGWSGNCLAIGHASHTMEPLTPAPITLLYRDIERLLDLLPHGTNMDIEQKEFNRLRANDLEHASIFQRALFETHNLPQTAYWQDMAARTLPAKLDRKITQFESRGLLTKFDLEPFNDEDWTILHFGMQRRSQRHDRLAESLAKHLLCENLDNLENSIQALSQKVPPHARYVENFRRYLEKKM